MTKIIRVVLLTLILGLQCGSKAKAQTINAASCNTGDVQNAINSAAEGGTVMIPAGTCTWTTGVTISGKGITVAGAGSNRIIAVSSSTLTLSTGSQTLTASGADPGASLSIATGATLTIEETGTESNFMTGTVTSYNSSTGSLVMNVTSVGGACGSNSLSNCKRWLIVNTPASQTEIINNDGTNTPLFEVVEDTSVHTNIGNIYFAPGTGLAHLINVDYTSGGQCVLLHDMRMSDNGNGTEPPNGNANMIEIAPNRGVIWNVSFDVVPYNLSSIAGVGMCDGANVTGNSWTTPSYMGSLDTTGQGKLYIEDCDFHAFQFGFGIDNNSRAAVRYSSFDNSAVGTHGADTSSYGQRYFEFYNNVGFFEGYSDGTTFNTSSWFYIRGGTALIYDNNLPVQTSQDYGTKPDLNMTVMNLQRNQGPNPCWGANYSTAGQYYQAPRQVGMGYVTGTGTANYPPDGVNNSQNDSVTYVGDSEPIYIWGNSRSPFSESTSDYGTWGGCSGTQDTSANYIKAGQNYIDGTAKPGWSPYTYPHPLRQGTTGPNPPTNLAAVVH